jgi:Flp pilus assembly protein TadG
LAAYDPPELQQAWRIPMAPKRSLIGRLLSPARRGRKLFSRDESGAVVVEFAILALPFFTLIFAILETSIVFLAGQILDASVHDASRRSARGKPSKQPGTLPLSARKSAANSMACSTAPGSS